MEITQELVKEFLDYNPENGVFKWRKGRAGTARKGTVAGWVLNNGYMHLELFAKPYKLHRLAWIYFYGNWPDGQIDHIDGNKCNNAISNLRVVGPADNTKNKRIYSCNKSGVSGVYWDKKAGKWRACIRVNRKLHNLGYFTDLNEAAVCRKEAEKRFGFHENHGNKLSVN